MEVGPTIYKDPGIPIQKNMGFQVPKVKKTPNSDHSPMPLGAWSKAQLKQIAKRGSHHSATACDFVHQDVHFP